jgi:6-phosphogluconate dehydrogenase
VPGSSFFLFQTVVGLSNEEIAEIFEEWQQGELNSYLIDITAKILRKKDDLTGKGFVVDYILDKTGMKGTGKWTVEEGADKIVAIPTIAAALDVRMMSALKEERLAASKIFDVASPAAVTDGDTTNLIEDLRAALYCAKICSYAQGLSLIKAASNEYNWNVDLSECARLWTGGCIIRAKLLDQIQAAFSNNKDLANLMVDASIASELIARLGGWRRTVANCVTTGVACPALCSSLNYFDTYRRGRLPSNLTQAQRDFFGGHTYERLDKPGRFHTAWTDAHKDIGDANQRTAGDETVG